MGFKDYFPFWDKLSEKQRSRIESAAVQKRVKKDTVLHSGAMDCTGLVLVKEGQLRAYIISEEGRQISIYRLFERDICLFSASCMINSIQFDVTVEAEKDSVIYLLPAEVYKELMEESLLIANYTNQIMASRFSEVMWLMEQIMWKSFDKRLAAYLLDEISLEGTNTLRITHERISSHMGTAREVVTRMLRYFQSEGLVKLSRGTIEILNEEGLEQL